MNKPGIRGPTGNPRVDAALALVETLSGRSRSTDVLNRFLPAYTGRRSRDASFLHELVMGVLRRRMALESILSGLLTRSLSKTEPLVRELLLSMAYQAIFLSRVPSHARVSASVDAARTVSGEAASRFVNAIGRALERKLADSDILEGMSPRLRYSMPDPILDRMKEILGRSPNAGEYASTALTAPSVFRVNRAVASRQEVLQKLEEAGIEAHETPHAPDGLVAHSPGVLRTAGLVPRFLVPQDEASQLVVEALDPQPGERILDLCAGTGIKTSQILGRAPGTAVVAVDRDSDKLDGCLSLCRSMGLPEPEILVRDVRHLVNSMKGTADAVLVDAPCTGIGTLVRRPEVRYLRAESDFKSASRLQAGILSSAVDLLAPGGRLVYAVCSFAREEGPEVVKGVLETRKDVEIGETLPDRPFGQPDGSLLTLPWGYGMDGFYVVTLRKV